MKCFHTTYGEDADGNRGKVILEYELEPEDEVEIASRILTQIIESGEVLPTYQIPLWCYIIDDTILIEIDLLNYIDVVISLVKLEKGYEYKKEILKDLKELKNEGSKN